MNRYRVEVLGRVPYGLTHNDVFASFNSLMRERNKVQSCSGRSRKDMVSLIVTFESEDKNSARFAAQYAASGVTGFSFDIVVRELS